MTEPQEIYKLDLERYGLAHLEGANLLDISDDDMDKLLKSLGEEDISLNIPIPCTPFNVQEMLTHGECRNCGKCCVPNPLNPESPGIEVFEEELLHLRKVRYPFEPYIDLHDVR